MKKYLLGLFAVLIMVGCTTKSPQASQPGSEAPEKFKIIHGPYLFGLTESEATLVWVTNRPSKSWVEYNPAQAGFYKGEPLRAYQVEHGLHALGTVHSIRLKGLTPGTKYTYRVMSQCITDPKPYRAVMGEIISTDVWKKPLNFTTFAEQTKQVKFKMVNDIHGKPELLNALLSGTNAKNTDFVIFNGDMASYITNENSLFAGFLDESVKVFATEVPIWYTRGNHETRGYFARELIKYFPQPGGKFYTGFRHGAVYFLILDCGEDKPDTDVEYSGLVAFDQYRSEETEWIKQIVQTPEFTSATFRVLICHMPFPRGGWHGPEYMKREWLPILNQAKIDVLLSGHTHQTRLSQPESCNFPVLENSDKTVLIGSGDGKSLLFEVKTPAGEIKQTLKIDAKQ